MIVDSMTFEEIHNELKTELTVCDKRFAIEQNKYRRAILKREKFPVVYAPIEYTTPKKNTALIYVEAKSKSDARFPLLTTIVYYRRKKGLYAVMLVQPNKGDIMSVIYTPHFFARYKQRFLNKDISSLEVIKAYFVNNPAIICDVDKNNELDGTVREGYVFGKVIKDDIWLVKTFITKDMMKGEQVKFDKKFMEQLDVIKKLKTDTKFSKLNPLTKLFVEQQFSSLK